MDINYETPPQGQIIFSFKKQGNSSKKVAEFLQQLVYLVSARHLRKRIQEEISASANVGGRSKWLTETFLYRALVIFNSGKSDDHLFDRADLSKLIEKIEAGRVSRQVVVFDLKLIEGKLGFYTTGHRQHLKIGFFLGKSWDQVDPELQKILKDVLENELKDF